MDIKKGGSFNARPYKNPFKGPFGPIFFAWECAKNQSKCGKNC